MLVWRRGGAGARPDGLIPAGPSLATTQALFQRCWFHRRLALLLAAHLLRKFADLGQVALHFAPSIPEGVIRTAVKGALERAHAVLKVHHEELLFDHRGRVVERQQIRKRISIV